jgi:hypothetical protein
MPDPLARWPLDEGTGTTSADTAGNGYAMSLTNMGWSALGGVKTTGAATSFMEPSKSFAFLDLANATFTVAMWINPGADSGTLLHYSAQSDGGGWCTPLLGFDGSGKLVAQVLSSGSTFTSVTDTTALASAWTHVAMTFTPSGSLVLYVGGVPVATTATSTRLVSGTGSVYLTFGGENSAGSGCSKGTLTGGPFGGTFDDVAVYDVALNAAQVAVLAASRP